MRTLPLEALLTAAVACGLAFAPAAPRQEKYHHSPESRPAAATVEAAAFVVDDLDRSVAFYSDVLGFRLTAEPAEHTGGAWDRLYGLFGVRVRVAMLQLGSERMELTEFLVPKGRPYPADSRADDRWFQHAAIVVSDLDQAYAVLRRRHVRHASTGPQTLPAWNREAGGIRAFYFRDPDGHFLECIQYPPGKGDPRWSAARGDGALFLGVDHSAITISATAASRAFYASALGLRAAGESENYGPEQEHLNHVAGARLHITGLRGASGIGVELLEYLHPRAGRAAPADTAPNDLADGAVTLTVPDLEPVASALRGAGARFVSDGIISFDGDASAPFRRALLARDPDGHALRVAEAAQK